jgi:hypothetical protein
MGVWPVNLPEHARSLCGVEGSEPRTAQVADFLLLVKSAVSPFNEGKAPRITRIGTDGNP